MKSWRDAETRPKANKESDYRPVTLMIGQTPASAATIDCSGSQIAKIAMTGNNSAGTRGYLYPVQVHSPNNCILAFAEMHEPGSVGNSTASTQVATGYKASFC